MATISSILAWEIPWTEEPGGIQLSWTQLKQLSAHTHIYVIHIMMALVFRVSFLTLLARYKCAHFFLESYL